MPSKSEKMAHLFYRVATGGPEGVEYGLTRGVKLEHAQRMYAEDMALGQFFDPQTGKPKYNPDNPRNLEQMKEDGEA